MRRIHRALNLTAFAQSQTLDGIRREEHIGRLWRIISLRGTQKSEALFGHLEPAFHDDRLSLRLGRIATPIFTSIFSLAALVSLVALVALVAALAATLIITPLLVVTAITSTALSAAAAALIVALPLMATVSLMVTTMTTSTTAAALTEAALATARTEGALMALLTLGPALLGIPLKPRGISSAGAGVTRIGSVGRLL